MTWQRRKPYNAIAADLNKRLNAWRARRELPRPRAIEALLGMALAQTCSECGGDQFDPCTCSLAPVDRLPAVAA